MARKKNLAAPRKPTQGKPMELPARGLPAAGSSHERVCWRFTHADMDGRWGLQTLTADMWCTILGKLSSFEGMTAQELRLSPMYTEYDLPNKLLPEALDRLDGLRLGDITKMGRLRLWQKARLYGVLESNVFHVVWWDPLHQIYPTEPKNT